MNFKDFFHDHTILTEVSQDTVDKLPRNIKQLLADKKLPFNNIFGDKLRIVQPLKGGKEYKTNISRHVGDQYEIDFDKWVGFKISDKDKKNPVRLGKILSKRKVELEKEFKEYQIHAPTTGVPEETIAYQTKEFSRKIGELDKLLKTTNLQKQVTDAELTSLYVVYSRAPIDVVRMGDMDFENYSCHSEGGDYFYCALGDAMMNAGVAYLISEEDYAVNHLDIDENLQVDELFLDNDRGISGIPALARIRIRLVLDSDGNELAVPTTKIYAKSGYQYNDDFKEQMIQWAKRQDTSNFKWDSTLSLKGGSYEDVGYKISDQVKLVWGKDIRYSIAYDDSKFKDEAEDEDGFYEENFYDQVVDELDRNEDEEIFNAFWGGDSDIGESESGISISITHRRRINFSFEIPGPVIDIIGKDILEATAAGGGKNVDGWVFSKRSGNFYFDSYADAPDLWDHGTWWGGDEGGDFDYDGYYEACRDLIESKLDSFSSQGYASEQKEHAFNYRYGFNKKVLEIFGVTIDNKTSESDEQIIAELLDPNYYYDEQTLLLEDYELDHIILDRLTDRNAQREGDRYGTIRQNIIMSASDIVKIKTALDTISNHIFKIINDEFPSVLDQDGIDLDYSLTLPSDDASSGGVFSFKDLFTGVHEHNKKVTLSSHVKYPTVDFILKHDLAGDYSDLTSIIDEMKLQEVYNAVKTLHEMDEDEKEAFLKLDVLHQELRQNRSKEFYDELKRQGQLELDLNRTKMINTNMPRKPTTFDNVYSNIILELNMGKGGMSNMSGQQGMAAGNAPAGVSAPAQSGVKMKFAGNPKFSSQTPGAGIQPTVPGASMNPANPAGVQDPNEIDEFTNLLNTRQQNPAEFQKAYQQIAQDPERNSRFLDFIMQQPVK